MLPSIQIRNLRRCTVRKATQCVSLWNIHKETFSHEAFFSILMDLLCRSWKYACLPNILAALSVHLSGRSLLFPLCSISLRMGRKPQPLLSKTYPLLPSFLALQHSSPRILAKRELRAQHSLPVNIFPPTTHVRSLRTIRAPPFGPFSDDRSSEILYPQSRLGPSNLNKAWYAQVLENTI